MHEFYFECCKPLKLLLSVRENISSWSSGLFSTSNLPSNHCFSGRFNFLFCTFQELVPSKCSFFLFFPVHLWKFPFRSWNGALRSRFRGLKQEQKREIKYTFVHFISQTREIQLPNFCEIKYARKFIRISYIVITSLRTKKNMMSL